MTTPDRRDPRAPVRSCIGCRTRRSSDELVRVTRAAGRIDVGGASNGRGAWLCRGSDGASAVELACLDAAVRRGAFAKAWRTRIGPDDEQAIRAELGGERP